MSSATKSVLKTTPVDKRFDNSNQINHCWNRYNEWVICLKKNEGDETSCMRARQMAMSLCPVDWVEQWDDERDAGKFMGVKYP